MNFFMKFRWKRIVYKSLISFLITYTFAQFFNIPLSFNLDVGLRLGWTSEIKERVSTQNIFHANSLILRFLFLFLPG